MPRPSAASSQQPQRTGTAGHPVIDTPLVSIIVPIRNEVEFIENCLRSILSNSYQQLEVLVIDGMSSDGTRKSVEAISADDNRVRLIDNLRRTVSPAMNLGIALSQGDVVIRVDGHATVEADYIQRCLDELRAHPECGCVGGSIETVSETLTGRTIAAAMQSTVGVGNSRFRVGNYEGYVDTLAFGAYRREVLDRVGLFDEELVRNQDDEFNARLIETGSRIWLSSRIRSEYFSRGSLRKLWRQYFQYGFWRIRTIQKRGRPATVRQVVPVLFVSLWLCLLALSPFHWFARIALMGLATCYAIGLGLGSVQVGRRTGWRSLLIAPLAFAVLHFAYGLGSLAGLVRFVLLRRGPVAESLSR